MAHQYDYESEIALQTEIARLRAALEAVDKMWSNLELSSEEQTLLDQVRKALANEQSPISVPTDTDPAAAPPAE